MNPHACLVGPGQGHGAVDEALEGEGLAGTEIRGLERAGRAGDVSIARKANALARGRESGMYAGHRHDAIAGILEVDPDELSADAERLGVVGDVGGSVQRRDEMGEVWRAVIIGFPAGWRSLGLGRGRR